MRLMCRFLLYWWASVSSQDLCSNDPGNDQRPEPEIEPEPRQRVLSRWNQESGSTLRKGRPSIWHKLALISSSLQVPETRFPSDAVGPRPWAGHQAEVGGNASNRFISERLKNNQRSENRNYWWRSMCLIKVVFLQLIILNKHFLYIQTCAGSNNSIRTRWLHESSVSLTVVNWALHNNDSSLRDAEQQRVAMLSVRTYCAWFNHVEVQPCWDLKAFIY